MSRENWLRSMVSWQMDSVSLPETWNYRWHLIYDNKRVPIQESALGLYFCDVISMQVAYLRFWIKYWALSGSPWTTFIFSSVWSPVWWVWTTAIFSSILVYKKLSEGCLWSCLSCSVFCLQKMGSQWDSSIISLKIIAIPIELNVCVL